MCFFSPSFPQKNTYPSEDAAWEISKRRSSRENVPRLPLSAYFSHSIRALSADKRAKFVSARAYGTSKLAIRRKRRMTLTSHVDVSGAAHVPPRENDEIEDVADDAEATNGRHHDAVADPSQSRRARILHVFRQQADIPNVADIGHVHHLVVRFSQRLSQLATSLPVSLCTRARLRTLSLGHQNARILRACQLERRTISF